MMKRRFHYYILIHITMILHSTLFIFFAAEFTYISGDDRKDIYLYYFYIETHYDKTYAY